jgi:predicted CoA-binding protein
MPIDDDEIIRKILKDAKTIAVVGASTKPWRDSNSIMSFLMMAGYTVYPVNPKYKEVLGVECFPNLKVVPDKIDIVDVFRRSEAVGEIAKEAVAVKARTLWMQFGVIHEEAAKVAEQAGLNVVMDRCILVEHRRLLR